MEIRKAGEEATPASSHTKTTYILYNIQKQTAHWNNYWNVIQDYMEEYEEHRGKGSFPAMITPAYLNAKKANDLASDVSMKQEV